jgi:hypothetical protein
MDDLRDSLVDRVVLMVTHNADDIAIGDIRVDLGSRQMTVATVSPTTAFPYHHH